MKNRMTDLRNHLFATLEHLLDSENPMDLQRAAAVADVAQVLVNSAKVEVDFMKHAQVMTGTGFIPVTDEPGRGTPALPGKKLGTARQ